MSECNGVVSAKLRIARARYVIDLNPQVARHE